MIGGAFVKATGATVRWRVPSKAPLPESGINSEIERLMIWIILGFMRFKFVFYRPAPLTNRFKFYHRQHQLQWGEHPIDSNNTRRSFG
jgi:hypothetical protein